MTASTTSPDAAGGGRCRRYLEQSWEYFRRADLHKLSAVDATSFAIMKRARIRLAYTFDHHFAVVGFRLVT
jgi:predicted nucleic acid-binding protein